MSSAVKRGHLLVEPFWLGGKPERLIRQSELEAILERRTAEAFEAGFQEGSAKGYELGDREGSQRAAEETAARLRKELADKFAALDGLIEEIRAERRKLIRSAEPETVALAITIAARVLCKQMEELRAPQPELIREAMRQTLDQKQMLVRLHPADRQALAQGDEPLEALCPGAVSVEFVEDESVSRGGCVVESNAGIVDAQIDRQIQQLRAALLA